MQTFNCGAAKVTWEQVAQSTKGVMQVAYYGPIGAETLCYLRGLLITLSMDAPAVVIRMDYAMFALDVAPPIPNGMYTGRSPPAALIVRRDAYAMWSAYGRQVAALGVKRAVFCDSQIELAYLWAEEHACLEREQLPLLR